MAIADEVQDTGRQVLAATGADLAGILNAGIERCVGWPYKIASGCIVDHDGTRTETFASVVYTAPEGSAAPVPGGIRADTAAAVIDVSEDMDLDTFRAAYARVALAKGLKKSPAPRLKDGPSTTVTLGIIFAQRSAVALEDFTEALQRLNAQTSSREWPDMIVVASTGAIHYAIQFPGESLSGDYLPPAEGALDNFTPAMYVVMVIRPTGARTFNKMLAFLIAHLAIFSPGAKLPNFTHLLEGVPETAVTVSGYQYNLRGDLVPVPRQFYSDRYIPPLPIRIEDRKGQLLSTIQFLPWQDGGALLLKGKLPLDGLMVFLGKKALQKAGVVRPPLICKFPTFCPSRRPISLTCSIGFSGSRIWCCGAPSRPGLFRKSRMKEQPRLLWPDCSWARCASGTSFTLIRPRATSSTSLLSSFPRR